MITTCARRVVSASSTVAADIISGASAAGNKRTLPPETHSHSHSGAPSFDSVRRRRSLCTNASPSGYHPARTPQNNRSGTHPPVISGRSFSSSDHDVEPVITAPDVQNAIVERAAQMAADLRDSGYYTATNVLPPSVISLLRSQSIALREKGRFEPSWSEKIVGGRAVRFDKEGVFACEPDGRDYRDAPDIIVYMSALLRTLPAALNDQAATAGVDLSASSFNAKLAVTSPGGSGYPLHIDNPQGLAVGDTRKLTCILYLNPRYKDGDGGQLRIFLPSSSSSDGGNAGETTLDTVDLAPEGGRLLLFWSDEMPHEVLPTAPDGARGDASLDRYALTVWIPTDNAAVLHGEGSRFRGLRDLAFP